MRIVEAPPNPSALIESMRDIGYSLGTALADLVDNSLTAGAGTIRIFADTSGPGAESRHPRRWIGDGRGYPARCDEAGGSEPLGGAGAVRPRTLRSGSEDCVLLSMQSTHRRHQAGRSDVQREVGSGLRRRDQSVAGSAPGEPGRHPRGPRSSDNRGRSSSGRSWRPMKETARPRATSSASLMRLDPTLNSCFTDSSRESQGYRRSGSF